MRWEKLLGFYVLRVGRKCLVFDNHFTHRQPFGMLKADRGVFFFVGRFGFGWGRLNPKYV